MSSGSRSRSLNRVRDSNTTTTSRRRSAVAHKKPSIQKTVPIMTFPTVVQQQDPFAKLDPYVLSIFNRIFSGSFINMPKPLSKLVRVFTSSTFTDTTIERNALMEEVYPKLKEYCRETYGLDFQVVDMRWGIRDEATDDHMTTKLCINEIANCQRLSVGANFVYGYRPIPAEILGTEMRLLLDISKEDNEDVSLLETWYIEDQNAVPSLFVLQAISSILINFNNKRMPKLQEEDAQKWWEIEEKVQLLLRKAARRGYEKGLIEHENMHNYFMSVTEREVIHGILKAKNPNEHCLCYIRHINNISLTQIKTASKFVDITHNHINTEAQKLLANLRDERVPSVLSSERIRRSTVEWFGRDGLDSNYHSSYIKNFCTDFYKSITYMVDTAMEKHAKFRDPMYTEVLQHLSNASYVSEMFFGRDEELSTIRAYVTSSNNQPLILHGENGCGKTSLLAKSATLFRKWLLDNDNTVIIIRFLGTTPDSSNITQLLTSVCNQIAYNYDRSQLFSAPTELSKLFQHFKRIMSLAREQSPLVILFDSIDLLSNVDAAHELLWLPSVLPKNVKFIASITSSSADIMYKMQRLIENKSQYLQVHNLSTELAFKVIKEWLKKDNRTISEKQWSIVQKAVEKSTLPLFIKLIYATVTRWKSYSRVQDTVLSLSVQDSIHALFQRTENQHGKLLVAHALSYITAARSGISDSEVEDLISLDDKVLDDIYQYHLPPIRRIPPLLWSRIRADLADYLTERSANGGVIVLNWYHAQFRAAAVERYFKNLNHLELCHSYMAEYFLGVWGGIPKPYQYTEIQKQRFGVTENEGLADRKVPKQPNVFYSKDGSHRYNTRKLNELPYHLLRAGRIEELLNLCLFNYDFLQAKLCCFPLASVVSDYEDAILRIKEKEVVRQLHLLVDALKLSSSIISRDVYMLAFEFLGRLLPLVPNNPLVKSLLVQCDEQSYAYNAFLPVNHCFHSPGGPLKYSLEEHMFAVFGMKLTSDRKLLVTSSNRIIVWDITTGDLTRTVNPNVDGIFFGLSISSDDKYAVSYTNNNQIIVTSLITGEFISIEPSSMTNQMEIQKIEFTHDKNIILWTSTEYLIYSTEGKLIQEGTSTDDQRKKLVNVFHSSSILLVLSSSGEKDEWSLSLNGKINGSAIECPLFDGAIAFENDQFNHGYSCIKNLTDGRVTFSFVKIAREQNRYFVSEIVLDNMQDRIYSIQIFKQIKAAIDKSIWVVGITIEKFLLYMSSSGSLIELSLPLNIRNIPIRPNHSTTVITFASNDTIFVAAIRKHLYFYGIESKQLLRALDAHFGRVLNLLSVGNENNTLITSSLDHTIKIWNLANIFEKSYSISFMEQGIEKIHVSQKNPHLVAVQTRKSIGIWDIRNHRYITSLVRNIHGSVISDSLMSSDNRHVVTIENDSLLLWDLRTQSVIQSAEVSNVYQIFLFYKEQYIGILSKLVDLSDQKTARFSSYSLVDFSMFYSFDFPCIHFREAVVLKDGFTGVFVTMFKGHDHLLVANLVEKVHIHKFRPKAPKRQKDVTIRMIKTVPHFSHQLIVLESDCKGAIWDALTRKFVRSLPEFSGNVSSDGKIGLYAPVKGGLFIIDMKTGGIIRTLIGNVMEGVNDVIATFNPSGCYVLYYHSGHKSLRVFRVSDGAHIGTLRPHSAISTWTFDSSGSYLIIGGQDGSLLSVAILETVQKEDVLKKLAQLPSRRHLAEHLRIPFVEQVYDDVFDLRNLGAVTAAITRFKSLLHGGAKRSHVCSLQ
ncbi:unnamed protein product [Auanema sp. JU1783]|nr:unnamed protein product [Auanema sp. JU1783]